MTEAGTGSFPHGVSAADVRSELSRAIASPEFANSERMRRFLTFVIERSLADDPDSLKEYTIGLEVFDRPSEYDPRIDSIVRVEARRLRRKLRQYYEKAPDDGPVRITLPEGGYVPVFESRHGGEKPENGSKPPTPVGGGVETANTIAVLPFVSLSPEPENEYFADGLTEEIISTLAKAPPLRVASRTSAFQFKNLAQDVRSIGANLGVEKVLEGSVRKAGESLRVTVQLVNVSDGLQMWAERFDRKLEDIFALQEEIAGSIAGVLKIRILHPESDWKPDHVAPGEAMFHVLEGRHFMLEMTPASLRRAMESFQRAVQLDPEFSSAYSAIAACLLQMSFFGDVSPASVAAHARGMIDKALRNRADNSWALTCRGILHAAIDWDWTAAETAFKRSIESNPSGPDNHCYYAGALLVPLGRFDEAEHHLQISLQADPRGLAANTILGMIHYLRGDNESALEQLEQTLSLNPAYYGAYRTMAYALVHQGDSAQAVKMLEKAQSLGTGDPGMLASLGFAYAKAGQTAESRSIAETLDIASRERYVSAFDRAIVRLGLGELDAACTLLNAAVAEQNVWLIYLRTNPVFEPLRGMKAFQNIITQVFASEPA